MSFVNTSSCLYKGDDAHLQKKVLPREAARIIIFGNATVKKRPKKSGGIKLSLRIGCRGGRKTGSQYF